MTARCADSLPADVVEQLGEVHRALREIDSQSEQFAALQRKYFLTLENISMPEWEHARCATERSRFSWSQNWKVSSSGTSMCRTIP